MTIVIKAIIEGEDTVMKNIGVEETTMMIMASMLACTMMIQWPWPDEKVRRPANMDHIQQFHQTVSVVAMGIGTTGLVDVGGTPSGLEGMQRMRSEPDFVVRLPTKAVIVKWTTQAGVDLDEGRLLLDIKLLILILSQKKTKAKNCSLGSLVWVRMEKSCSPTKESLPT